MTFQTLRGAAQVLLLGMAAFWSAPAAAASDDGLAFFEARIRPVLIKHCYGCHSREAGKGKAGLYLDSGEAIRRGGASGPAVVPGDPEASLLIQAVRFAGDEPDMPPKQALWLSPQQIADLEAWVKMGAPDPRDEGPAAPVSTIDWKAARGFWSFRPVEKPAVPHVRDARWGRNPIDRFIQARREAEKLTPVGQSDRRTLIRRLSFDLVGLPPAPEDIERFVTDPRPDAYERLVEHLLASPQYGERWGRHWLDVVRYADTAGDNADFPIPQAYRYRDYVTASFNRDKPYNEFLEEQIAGDLLPAANEAERQEQIIATGFIALSRRFQDDINKYVHLTIEDTISTVGQAMLGLTVGCALCHDHKYDPITQKDYYGLYGIFASTRYPFPGCETRKWQDNLVPLLPSAEADALLGPYRSKLADLQSEADALRERRRFLLKAISKATAERDALGVAKDCQKNAATPVCRAQAKLEALGKEHDEVKAALPKFNKMVRAFATSGMPNVPTAFAVGEAEPTNAKVHVKGDHERLGGEVPRRFLTILGGQQVPPEEGGSGRRSLASWLSSKDNPLTARVMVNRIWQHHFGRGLVATPNDFGSRGEAPTHPELLDFLAATFMERGWSVKAIHRLIVSSLTYRMATTASRTGLARDPENRLLWRQNMRRLDAEQVRDAILMVSGELDLAPGGPHQFPHPETWSFSAGNVFKAEDSGRKRSVYLPLGRVNLHPVLQVLDGADPNTSTGRRVPTTTPLQALFAMNAPFVAEQAERVAVRLQFAERRAPARVALAYKLLLGRAPSATEIGEALSYLERYQRAASSERAPAPLHDRAAWTSLARAMLASNEFMHVN